MPSKAVRVVYYVGYAGTAQCDMYTMVATVVFLARLSSGELLIGKTKITETSNASSKASVKSPSKIGKLANLVGFR